MPSTATGTVREEPSHHHQQPPSQPQQPHPSTARRKAPATTTTDAPLLSHIQIASTDIPQAYITPICGAAAGAASGIVTCPLDVIKTKLQARGAFNNHIHAHNHRHAHAQGARDRVGGRGLAGVLAKIRGGLAMGKGQGQGAGIGMIGTGKMILRDEGVRGFYRGLAPMLLGYLPTWAVYMTVYDVSRRVFGAGDDGGASLTWWLSRMGASVTAGACSTIVTNPIWVIKTRLMSQSILAPSSSSSSTSTSSTSTSPRISTSDGSFATRPRAFAAPSWGYKGTIDAFIKIYTTEGIRTFYSGLTPALLGLSHVAIQFPLYEFFKMQFTGYEIGEVPKDSSSSSSMPAAKTQWMGISAATFLSKVCASTITYPHEVLRTRMQTQQRYMPPGRFGEHGVSVSVSDPRIDTHRDEQHEQSTRSKRPTTTTAASSSDGMANRPRYYGVVQSCKTILREEGWRAFYSGIGTNLFRAIPSAMTTMLTYEYLKGWIGWMQREGEGVLEEMEMMRGG